MLERLTFTQFEKDVYEICSQFELTCTVSQRDDTYFATFSNDTGKIITYRYKPGTMCDIDHGTEEDRYMSLRYFITRVADSLNESWNNAEFEQMLDLTVNDYTRLTIAHALADSLDKDTLDVIFRIFHTICPYTKEMP